MTTFDARTAEVDVLTFKEGFLSPIAHDLRIRVEDVHVEVDQQIRAEIDLSSLRVVCARKDQVDEPGTLSQSDRDKIQKTIREEVLHTQRYPMALFEAELDRLQGDRLLGELELHGEVREIEARLTQKGADLHVELTVHQPDFNIKPYSAMMGTLRVRPDVIIRVVLKDFSLETT